MWEADKPPPQHSPPDIRVLAQKLMTHITSRPFTPIPLHMHPNICRIIADHTRLCDENESLKKMLEEERSHKFLSRACSNASSTGWTTDSDDLRSLYPRCDLQNRDAPLAPPQALLDEPVSSKASSKPYAFSDSRPASPSKIEQDLSRQLRRVKIKGDTFSVGTLPIMKEGTPKAFARYPAESHIKEKVRSRNSFPPPRLSRRPTTQSQRPVPSNADEERMELPGVSIKSSSMEAIHGQDMPSISSKSGDCVKAANEDKLAIDNFAQAIARRSGRQVDDIIPEVSDYLHHKGPKHRFSSALYNIERIKAKKVSPLSRQMSEYRPHGRDGRATPELPEPDYGIITQAVDEFRASESENNLRRRESRPFSFYAGDDKTINIVRLGESVLEESKARSGAHHTFQAPATTSLAPRSMTEESGVGRGERSSPESPRIRISDEYAYLFDSPLSKPVRGAMVHASRIPTPASRTRRPEDLSNSRTLATCEPSSPEDSENYDSHVDREDSRASLATITQASFYLQNAERLANHESSSLKQRTGYRKPVCGSYSPSASLQRTHVAGTADHRKTPSDTTDAIDFSAPAMSDAAAPATVQKLSILELLDRENRGGGCSRTFEAGHVHVLPDSINPNAEAVAQVVPEAGKSRTRAHSPARSSVTTAIRLRPESTATFQSTDSWLVSSSRNSMAPSFDHASSIVTFTASLPTLTSIMEPVDQTCVTRSSQGSPGHEVACAGQESRHGAFEENLLSPADGDLSTEKDQEGSHSRSTSPSSIVPAFFAAARARCPAILAIRKIRSFNSVSDKDGPSQ